MNNEQINATPSEENTAIPQSVYFKTIGRIALIFFIGFFLFLLFSSIILIFLTKPDAEIEIPHLVGKQYIEVHNSLVRKGLRPIIKFHDVFDLDNGLVLSQHPEAGNIVSEGSTLKLTVSRSALLIDVPNLTGIELPFALNKIKNLHIRDRSVTLPVGIISYIPSNTIAENVVIAQSPQKGEKVTLDRKINFLVSAGKKDVGAKMPDVTGQSIDLCTPMLMARGVVSAQEIVATTERAPTEHRITDARKDGDIKQGESNAQGQILSDDRSSLLRLRKGRLYHTVRRKSRALRAVSKTTAKSPLLPRQMSPGRKITFVSSNRQPRASTFLPIKSPRRCSG
jgi:beta-lactam-binding protein with PASTA domain